ncbi:MAG: hypothetical protein KatS3mg111_4011 [Pirellulaceae bacterium]|nr:MAG: hypothetical protein KatS3mg111_4011 [Pirellulaceae bacterium]
MMRPTWLVVLSCLLLAGCWHRPPAEEFGVVTGRDSIDSVNGVGFFREMWEERGVRCYAVKKLSPRLQEFDAIVLIGDTYAPPGQAARQWLMEWVSAEEGRSIIYFGRDYNAAIHYYRQLLGTTDPSLHPRVRQEIAWREVSELRKRHAEIDGNVFAEWFYLDIHRPLKHYQQFQGVWADALNGLPGAWPVRSVFHPPSLKWKTRVPSRLNNAAVEEGASPAATLAEEEETPTIRRSVWSPDEFATLDDWHAAFRRLPASRILLSGEDGTPLIYRLVVGPGGSSQVLVLANGAPLLNASIVEPMHQRIGQQLIAACLPARRVAMIRFDQSGLLITDAPDADGRGIGLEMLTVWPLSVITMTAALVGILCCAALFPILGRPQSLPQRRITDFGLHVESLGKLWQRTGDQRFALETLRDYYWHVRGEPPPDWGDRMLHDPQPTEQPGHGHHNRATDDPQGMAQSPSALAQASAPSDPSATL